jgi:hypothetical protein
MRLLLGNKFLDNALLSLKGVSGKLKKIPDPV